MSALSLETEFINVFLDESNPFRESVTYTPSGGAVKAIYGIVNRGGNAKSTTGRGMDKLNAIYDYTLLISCNATDGIQYVVPNKDRVLILAPEFGENNTFLVAGVIAKTAMCWYLGLRP